MLPLRLEWFLERWPFVVIGAGILVIGLSFFGLQYYLRVPWNDAAHARAECVLAGEIATAITSNRDLGEPTFPDPEIGFSPHLAGSPYEGGSISSRYGSRGGSEFFFAVRTIDCYSEFAKHRLALVALPIRAPVNLGAEIYSLSRISISPQGESVTVRVSMICGNVCGYGWRTLWKRQAGRWVLTSKDMLWIS